MKTAGVSLIAAATPIPAPAQRAAVPPRASSLVSARTRASSSRLTCPKLTVSRTGSSSAYPHTATAMAYQGVHPRARITGPAVQRTIRTAAAALSSRVIATAAGQAVTARGSMHSAANGG